MTWGRHWVAVITMPDLYCQSDASWIQEQLQQLTPSLRRKVAVKYAEVYQAAFDAEPVFYRQENRARHEANTRLRLFVGKYHRAAMGLTEKPTLARSTAQHGGADVPEGNSGQGVAEGLLGGR